MKRSIILIIVVVVAIALAGVARSQTREQGQTGVDLMVAAAPPDPQSDPDYRDAIDRVCAQRDCFASHLYWYTDFDLAKAEARASGKPILSLRLLGRLDEELSCANSRFFRTTLYSDPKIARFMRDHFVLYWQSERAVPKITIEFEDGRRIHQTITGNSIHYLLDQEGRPLDALPGLYSPEDFLLQLENFANLARQYSAIAPAQRSSFLRIYHSGESFRLAQALGGDLRSLRGGVKPPTARQAARMTQSKAALERPLLVSFDLSREPITDAEWKRIAERYEKPVHFDPASIALMREKHASPEAFDRMLQNLERSVAEDTVRNEYDLHLRIHEWFAAAPPASLDTLNQRVYSELFLTPRSDPWFGLLQKDVFVAIDNGGVESR
jgi:hypothetical protein